MSTAIHDIGYRHYDGPRLGRGQTLRALYTHNLRALFGLGRGAKAKIIPFALAAFLLLPALADVAIKAIVKEAQFLIPMAAYGYGFQPLIAIFLAALAPVVASREIRYRSVPLYFSRPVGPWDFVAAKFGAFATALVLLVGVPVTVMYVGFLLTRSSLIEAAQQGGGFGSVEDIPTVAGITGDWALALLGVVLLALVLSSFALLVAAFTPRRGFGVAAVIALYLISNVVVGIVQGISQDRGAWDVAAWMNLFTPFNLVYSVQVALFDAESEPLIAVPDTAMGLTGLLLCVLVVAGSLAALHARYRKAGA
ncbi:ABC transporter permease [Actinocorallia sp. API 0066]|uniref:ABC transporter permease n=1 Tax=Actinocorallia sp. API 0066 TaxID=2896846 RepID=UPI001E643266|nr:ABC transporter permease [Actinocorallia sp. API 0066]MCD0450301.1 ABC transporter permease [Actinocorallia sp. API 0066]